jgi:hypothetical protein
LIPEGRELKSNGHSYNNHSNKSYKKLTEKEKKAIEFLSNVHRLKHKAMILGDLRYIMNEILVNSAYHEKNLEESRVKWEKVKIPKDEKEVLLRTYELNNRLAKNLLSNLRSFLDGCEKELNK